MLKKKDVIIVSIVVVNLIEVFLIKPIIPHFYIFPLSWKICYIIGLFGSPLIILVPIILVTLPIAYFFGSSLTLKERWVKYTKNLFLTVSIIFLFLSSILLIASKTLPEDKTPFRLIRYSDINSCAFNTDDLRTGEFTINYATIQRYDSLQVENYGHNKIKEYKIKWLSNCEYRLIPIDKTDNLLDIIDVKITNNYSDYYDCYVKIGEYAVYNKIKKK